MIMVNDSSTIKFSYHEDITSFVNECLTKSELDKILQNHRIYHKHSREGPYTLIIIKNLFILFRLNKQQKQFIQTKRGFIDNDDGEYLTDKEFEQHLKSKLPYFRVKDHR